MVNLLVRIPKLQADRTLWIFATGVVSGFAIWATHFIAMLAFSPPTGVAYDPTLTFLSLVIAVLMAALGIAIAVSGSSPWLHFGGGAVVGTAIAAMHFTGMAGFQVSGQLSWSTDLVIAALLIGPLLSGLAFWMSLHGELSRHRIKGAALFASAVCAHHFIAMGSVEIVPDPTVLVSASGISQVTLAIGTAIGGALLVLAALIGLEVDRRFEQRKQSEFVRMRDLADAAVEGLVITDGARVIAANKSFRDLVQLEIVIGLQLTALFRNGVPDSLTSEGKQSCESLIVARDGSEIPVEVVARPLAFDGALLRVLAFRDLRERRSAELEIKKLAYSDALTDLPNRRSFSDRLSQQLAASSAMNFGFAVLAIDLDRFKSINDTLGHGMGDRLLGLVAGRLRSVVREGDFIARIGGDEFAVLVSRTTDASKARKLASRIINMLSRPYLIDGHILSIGASVGIAMFPEDGNSAEEITKNADLALYRAKECGRGTYAFFEAEMDAAMQRRRTLELELNRAVSRQEFELHYQPQLDVRGGKVAGYEALIRWRHPTRGLIPPGEFIPIAEEIGLITSIGEWALEIACKQATQWPDDISIAVNLSSAQFASPRLVDAVRSALENSGLAANRLELEITETVLLQETAAIVKTLAQLQALGVQISMDDFGTGYSSLNYLRAFPFNKIKIDRSFVTEIGTSQQSKAIVGAIIALGRSLGMTTTAEGVETPEQAALLSEAGCDHLQGYLIGRPAAAVDTAFVREQAPSIEAA